MTKQDFLNKTKNLIIQNLAITNNQIMGVDKTAFLSIGLFLNLPVKINLIQQDYKSNSKSLQPEDLSELLTVYT